MESHGHRGGWARHGIALALLSLAAGQAAALGLGRIAAQSALGEPLRVEIEVSSITPEEAASLQVRIAGPEAYQAAGVEYNPILTSARAVLQRRPDGRTVLRLLSDRVVHEPFVELILDLAWPTGHLVRSYTLLIDPPAARTAAASAPPASAATLPRSSVTAAVTPAPVSPAPVASPALPPPAAPPQRRPITPAASPGMFLPAGSDTEPRPSPSPRSAAVRPAEMAAAGSSAGADRYVVRPGDTLAGIAGRTRPAGVSLDQMLASLYRANTGAFIGNNIHRLRSGVVLNVPSADEVRTLAPEQARQTIQAQSADFDAYRRGLAAAAREGGREEASRRASGSLQAAVEDRKAGASNSPDRLTLGKDANTVASVQDALESLQRERRDAEVRLSALMRSIEELKALAGQTAASAPRSSSAASGPGQQPALSSSSAAPALPASSPVAVPGMPAVLPSPVAAASASSPDPALAAQPAASTSAAAQAPRLQPPESTPEADSAVGSLMEGNALPLGLAALLLTAALVVGGRRLRRRQANAESQTSFLDSSLKVDSPSLAAASAAPDSRHAPLGALSSGYSLSQLDAGGDVDPVAEADVYLAYGRDLQAEEILKDAMRSDPDRLAIRTKLLEVYAKRRDIKGFEVLASQLHALTLGQGEEWELAQQLGRGIDADNPLYAPGGSPRRDDGDLEGVDDPLGPNTLPQVVLLPDGTEEMGGDSPVDIDLDLNFDDLAPAAQQPAGAQPQTGDLPPLDFGPAPTRAAADSLTAAVSTGAPASMDAGSPDLLELDLLDLSGEPAVAARAPVASPAAQPSNAAAGDATPDLLELDMLDLPAAAPSAEPAQPSKSADDFSLDFDLSGISLDLDLPANAPPAPVAGPGSFDQDAIDFFAKPGAAEPVERKLDLAEELLQLGDSEGARDLLTEVVERSEGAQKARAESLLAQLG